MPVERSAWRNAPLQLDETILAIGDVHGCDRELALLLEELSPLAAERPARLIFLGDLICRGRSSLAALAFWAARQFEVAREHIARIEWLALARIGQPSAAALAQLATVIVAVAWVITPTRIEVHSYLRLETLLQERTENGGDLATSPECLQNSGRMRRTGGDSRGRQEAGK